jgi:aspartate-semialdehyde dehydrogenase
MPSSARASDRIVIAGASSLLGAELKALLEESKFAGWDFRLLDEEESAGTLTEAGGEAAVIQPVEEGSFARARFVFFTGSAQFTASNLAAARKSSARIIDLSAGTRSVPDAAPWFPKLDALLARKFSSESTVYTIPTAAATIAASLALRLSKLGTTRMALTSLQSVSEAGRVGIEELESQTGQLLSFQAVGQPVFDVQVAFNLLDRYGSESRQSLKRVEERLRAEVQACLGTSAALPALCVLHAPVFYGSAFSSYVELAAETKVEQLLDACRETGFAIPDDGSGPSNVSVAGEKTAHLAKPEADSSRPGAWWLWGAADNIRLPAANAVKLAEMLA